MKINGNVEYYKFTVYKTQLSKCRKKKNEEDDQSLYRWEKIKRKKNLNE